MTMTPNWENNERNTMVAFGDFGNRDRVGEPGALFPVKLEIVDDGTPLTFVGPNGTKSGVGLTWETDISAYESGPSLVGAKLNRIGDAAEGEGGVGLFEAQTSPNDEFASSFVTVWLGYLSVTGVKVAPYARRQRISRWASRAPSTADINEHTRSLRLRRRHRYRPGPWRVPCGSLP